MKNVKDSGKCIHEQPAKIKYGYNHNKTKKIVLKDISSKSDVNLYLDWTDYLNQLNKKLGQEIIHEVAQ